MFPERDLQLGLLGSSGRKVRMRERNRASASEEPSVQGARIDTKGADILRSRLGEVLKGWFLAGVGAVRSRDIR